MAQLGLYPITSTENLLQNLEGFEVAMALLGIVFGIIVLLLIAISVLLIYSLLQNSVDVRTRDHGTMRLCGMSKI